MASHGPMGIDPEALAVGADSSADDAATDGARAKLLRFFDHTSSASREYLLGVAESLAACDLMASGAGASARGA